LHGNRFRILIRDADANHDSSLQQCPSRIRTEGMPNYYGTQRFGKDGETARLGLTSSRGTRRRCAIRSCNRAVGGAVASVQLLSGPTACRWPDASCPERRRWRNGRQAACSPRRIWPLNRSVSTAARSCMPDQYSAAKHSRQRRSGGTRGTPAIGRGILKGIV
jgi:hypothetical protein